MSLLTFQLNTFFRFPILVFTSYSYLQNNTTPSSFKTPLAHSTPQPLRFQLFNPTTPLYLNTPLYLHRHTRTPRTLTLQKIQNPHLTLKKILDRLMRGLLLTQPPKAAERAVRNGSPAVSSNLRVLVAPLL